MFNISTSSKNLNRHFFSSSGYGDGGYDVFGVKKGDVYVALKIVFISDNEEDDDDDWDEDDLNNTASPFL